LGVLRELELAESPLSHQDMLLRLADYCWDSATIFRNLRDLCDAGLVIRIDAGDHTWRFELAQRPAHQIARHPHFLCVACGAITCLHDISLSDAGRRLRIPSHVQQVEEVLLKGRCQNCVETLP
jgi:Fur family ferric uptake transcriptional regulator